MPFSRLLWWENYSIFEADSDLAAVTPPSLQRQVAFHMKQVWQTIFWSTFKQINFWYCFAPTFLFPLWTTIPNWILHSKLVLFLSSMSILEKKIYASLTLHKLNFNQKELFWFQRSLFTAWDINLVHKSLQLGACCGPLSLNFFLKNWNLELAASKTFFHKPYFSG